MLVAQRNLSDVHSASRARANLQLGSAATLSSFDTLTRWQVRSLRLSDEETESVLKASDDGSVQGAFPLLWSFQYDEVGDVPISVFKNEGLVERMGVHAVATDGLYTSLEDPPRMSAHHPLCLANDVCDRDLGNLASPALSRRNLGLHPLARFDANGSAEFANVVVDSLTVASLRRPDSQERGARPLTIGKDGLSVGPAGEFAAIASADGYGTIRLGDTRSFDRVDMAYTVEYQYAVYRELEARVREFDVAHGGVLQELEDLIASLDQMDHLMVSGDNLSDVSPEYARANLGVNTVAHIDIDSGDRVHLLERDLFVERMYLRHMAIVGVYNQDEEGNAIVPTVEGSRPMSQYRKPQPLVVLNGSGVLSNLYLNHFSVSQSIEDHDDTAHRLGMVKINDILITDRVSWSQHRNITIQSEWYNADDRDMVISYRTMDIHGKKLLGSIESHTLKMDMGDFSAADVALFYETSANLQGYDPAQFDIASVLELAPVATNCEYDALTIKPTSLAQFENDEEFMSAHDSLSSLYDAEAARKALGLGTASVMDMTFDAAIRGERIELEALIVKRGLAFTSGAEDMIDPAENDLEGSVFMRRGDGGVLEWGVLPTFSFRSPSSASCVMLTDYEIDRIPSQRYRALTSGALVRFVDHMETVIRTTVDRIKKMDRDGLFDEKLRSVLSRSSPFVGNAAYARLLERTRFAPTAKFFEKVPRIIVRSYM